FASELSEGAVFGEIGLLEGATREASVTVVSADAEVLFMSTQNFEHLLNRSGLLRDGERDASLQEVFDPYRHSWHSQRGCPRGARLFIQLGRRSAVVFEASVDSAEERHVPLPERGNDDVRRCAGFGRSLLVREPASRDSVYAGAR